MATPPLLKNIRFFVLLSSALIAGGIYIYVNTTIQGDTAQAIRLDQLYALISIIYLYFTLLVSPLTRIFPQPGFRNPYMKSRRAIGVSAFFFGLLHVFFSFFKELDGFAGLGFLNNNYLFSILLGFIALIIMTILALTAFDFIIGKLTFRKWKIVHRLIYIAAILILVHTLLLGSHFINLSNLIPQIFIAAVSILLFLEALRFDEYLNEKFNALPKFGITVGIFFLFISLIGAVLYFPSNQAGLTTFNVHSQHIQIAKQVQQGSINPSIQSNPNLSKIPGLNGDATRRYSVSFFPPEKINPNQDVKLEFHIYDANSGNKINLFNKVYEKPMHLIIVDNELSYFNHIHPDQIVDGFAITTQFPHQGRFHLYTDFQPLGGIEQQFGFVVDVGKVETALKPTQPVDTENSKTFSEYEVTLIKSAPLKASEMSIGNQPLTFNIKDKTSKNPITNLKPYLAAFGHLVMINQDTYDYLHVHPSNFVAPSPNSNGGPQVQFLPLGLYGPIKPGNYRIFAQFNPENKLFVADFTIKVE